MNKYCEEGLFTEWYENGQKENMGTYNKGQLNGLLTEWDKNGQKSYEGTYKDGIQVGLWTSWYENGQKESEINFKDGSRYGSCTGWYKNGQKRIESTYINEPVPETRIGIWTYWDKDDGKEYKGEVVEIDDEDGHDSGWDYFDKPYIDKVDGEYLFFYKSPYNHPSHHRLYPSHHRTYRKDGRTIGIQTDWKWNGESNQRTMEREVDSDSFNIVGKYCKWYHDGNGQKEKMGTYNNGLRDGLWTKWYKNGQKKSEINYKDDKKISSRCWYKDGNEKPSYLCD